MHSPTNTEHARIAKFLLEVIDIFTRKYRLGEILAEIQIRSETPHFRRVPADDKNFSLYPPGIGPTLRVGDFISIDFNSVLVQVIACERDFVVMRVLHGGSVGQNKAVTVQRKIPMPALTEKDRLALRIGADLGLRHFALSFASRGADVDELRSLVGENAVVISKIESRAGLENLEEIALRSDALLIDRGDLSREIPLELLPQTQKSILARAKRIGRRVYVATNLLESMVSLPTPTRAEVNDIFNTLADGADGLVLAAETAIGRYPIQCASMVSRIIRGFEPNRSDWGGYFPVEAVSLLVEPHGGRLVHREAVAADRDGMEKLPRLTVSEKILLDCEQIACGTYSPLTGFMDRETLLSVLARNRLPDGAAWTLPILLQVPSDAVRAFGPGDRVALTSVQGAIHALMDVSQIYSQDLESLAREMYGTSSREHPGVGGLMGEGDSFVAGDITLVEPLQTPHRHYLLTPAQSRFVFTQLGWSLVVGFHGRNPPHRGHEWIQNEAVERTGADGLYINPGIGPKKKGDFLPELILSSYQTLLEFGCYPKGRVVLGSFFTYSRYAGPREAVFTALCRKNMGCSHFIVGRDHTGVGNFYPADANRRLFESLGDLGVLPVFFGAVGYNPATRRYEVDRDGSLAMISGTEVRETLRAGRHLPDWFMRDIVQEVLLLQIRNGAPVFYE